jgi:hypothetical protein
MTDTTLNPYHPPSEINPPPLNAAGSESTCFRDGKFLVIREGSVLPNRCIVSNQVVDSKGWRKPFRILWSPRWILWTMIGGPIIYACTIACTQKRAKFTVSMGKGVRRKMAFSRLISLSMLAGVVGCIYACAKFARIHTPEAVTATVITGSAAFVLLLIMGVIAKRAIPLKAVKHAYGFFAVKGCSEAFLSTLPAIIPSPFEKGR